MDSHNELLLSSIVTRLDQHEVVGVDWCMDLEETKISRCYCPYPRNETNDDIKPWLRLTHREQEIFDTYNNKILQFLNHYSTGIKYSIFADLFEQEKGEELNVEQLNLRDVSEYLYHLAVPPQNLVEFRISVKKEIYIFFHQCSEKNAMRVGVQEIFLHEKKLITPMKFLQLTGGCNFDCSMDLDTLTKLQFALCPPPSALIPENIEKVESLPHESSTKIWLSQQISQRGYYSSSTSSKSITFIEEQPGMLFEEDIVRISRNPSPSILSDHERYDMTNVAKMKKKSTPKKDKETKMKVEVPKTANAPIQGPSKTQNPDQQFSMTQIGKKANDEKNSKIETHNYNKKKKSSAIRSMAPKKPTPIALVPTVRIPPKVVMPVPKPVEFVFTEKSVRPAAAAEHNTAKPKPNFAPFRRTLLSNASETLQFGNNSAYDSDL